MKSSLILASIAVLVALLFSNIQGARANSLDCDKKWTGPSADNDVMECILDENRLDTQLWVAIVLVVPILALVITLLCYPVAFIGRFCCGICGSNKRRPGAGCCCDGKDWDGVSEDIKNRAYPKKYVSKIKTAAFLLAFVSIGSLVVMTVGAEKLHGAYLRAVDEIFGIIDYLDDILLEVRTYATLESGEFIPPLSKTAFESFSNVTHSFEDFVGDFKDQYDPIMDNSHSGLVALSVLPTLFLFLGFFYAAFDIRKCLPVWTTFFYFLFVIIYTLVCLLCMVMALVFYHLCTEIELHNERRPGVIQWYVVPQCYEKAAFAQFETDIHVAQRDNSIAACENMQQICSPAVSWSQLNPQLTYQCNITDPTRECTSMSRTLEILSGIKPKQNMDVEICNASIPNNEACTFDVCSTYCRDPLSKQASTDALTGFNYARRFLNASDVIRPLLNCNAMVDIVLRPFQQCEDIRDGFFFLGAGSGVSFILLMYGIVTLFIGQKVFFKVPKTRDELLKSQEHRENREKRLHRKSVKGKQSAASKEDGRGVVMDRV